MRTLVAWCALAACVAHAHSESRDPYKLLSYLGIQEPFTRLLTCSQTLGPTKCLAALSSWRAMKAIESFTLNRTMETEQFPWEEYNSTSNEQIYSQLCEGTEKLLQYRKLSFTMIPGYRLELLSKENGKINVDVFKNEIETGRGSMKKQFYNIVPLLLIPGLIMSAILPFVLPAMKLATVASIMLNNMALTGAVFTLLRDNAFNDNYRPKVKYINAGWKNEKELYREHEHASNDHEYHESDHHEYQESHHDDDLHDAHYSQDNVGHEHVGQSTKLLSIPDSWVHKYKDAVELNLQYNPHKRRG